MKILILEDSQERIEFFKRIYKNHELYITADLDDAQQTAQHIELDILFLDHDLTINNFKAIQEERTGYDFCKFLVNYKSQKHALIYIHSMNPTGANAMLNLLKDNNYQVEWIPFYLLKIGARNG